jgi:hypothetical protein
LLEDSGDGQYLEDSVLIGLTTFTSYEYPGLPGLSLSSVPYTGDLIIVLVSKVGTLTPETAIIRIVLNGSGLDSYSKFLMASKYIFSCV